MKEQCFDCYYVSDRSIGKKQLFICDNTINFECWGHNVVKEIPKEYKCYYYKKKDNK